MVEGRSGACFLLKAAHPVVALHDIVVQQLERHLAPQPLVLRQVNFAHSTCAKTNDDLILVDVSPNRHGHRSSLHDQERLEVGEELEAKGISSYASTLVSYRWA